MAQEYFSSEFICGINAAMEFIPLHFRDRLTIINPQGTIGVVTLWSKVDYVIERFRQAGVNLDPATSPIAVFGTLYGNGLRELLRNLLYNPQIQTLMICGNDRSGSAKELINFFELGTEPVPNALIRFITTGPSVKSIGRIGYESHLVDFTELGYNFGNVPLRIKQTQRIIDPWVTRETFEKLENNPILKQLVDPHKDETVNEIRKLFASFEPPPIPKIYHLTQVPLPEVEVQYFPSNPRAHLVVQDTILDAWKDVLHLLSRFGHRVHLKKGERLELQHVKVVVEQPRFESEAKLHAVNLDPQKLRRYQEDILRGELRPDETYTYGHRLRAHFGLDALAACAERLKSDPEDRKSYVALWDTARDLTVKEGRPCLVSLFFRKFEGKLTLSATFRTHNAMDAWPMNVYGLMAIRDWVAKKAGLLPGAITVISHSLGLDPRELDRSMLIIGKRPFKVNLDPMGYFRITLDGKEILVEHRFEDVTLKEYRGKSGVSLQHQIARDVAISDINHAIYLGRQLAKAEMALKDGREFVQD
jgi:thymidylate synthase